MAEQQAKVEEKQENMAETNQKCQKPVKTDRKTAKMRSFTNYLLPCSQATISVNKIKTKSKLLFGKYNPPNSVMQVCEYAVCKTKWR